MINGIEESDFLVIGSGIAGLTFALKAAEFGTVNLVTKLQLTDTATRLAQGGIAAVMSEEDSFESHIEDTIRVGCGLCHRDVVEQIITDGPSRIKDLVELGVKFCSTDGSYDLGLEGGHSYRRVLHVKDHTGKNIEKALVQAVRKNGNIRIFENHVAVNLVTKNNEALGAYVLVRESGEIRRFAARATVLATGGVGKVFLYTSNPKHATGDGIAMAYRAGAAIANMEFVQFHPTLLFHHKLHSFLISEALRGEGAVLIGPDGERFMSKYHPKAELAPRDIVARAIDAELKRTGAESVFLDISFKDSDWVRDRFPAIYETCKSVGIDITKEPIPVVPGAHYCCGGVATDINGRTDVKGLFAIGETACTGFHGANRLASNSLLEGVVVGHNAAMVAVERLKCPIRADEIRPWDPGEATDPDELVIISHTWEEIRRIMTNYVGIVRSRKRLIRARNRIDFIRREIEQFYWDFKITPDLVELRNIATVAELIVRHARMRRESRGAHYNQDYPNESDQLVDTLIKKGYDAV